jgi:hypothetical protein
MVSVGIIAGAALIGLMALPTFAQIRARRGNAATGVSGGFVASRLSREWNFSHTAVLLVA